MTELYREYRRCGNCRRTCWVYNICQPTSLREIHKKVNPGWFGCRLWISKKQLPDFATLANEEPSFIAEIH